LTTTLVNIIVKVFKMVEDHTCSRDVDVLFFSATVLESQ